MPDNVTPVIVGDSHLGILLGEILLHLLQRCGSRTVVGDVLQLLVDDWVQLAIATGIGIVGNLQGGIRMLVLIQVEIYADTVSTAFLLTNRVGIGDRETTLQEVELEIALWGEIYICGQVDADISQWCSHLFGELYHLLSIHNLWYVGLVGLFVLASSRQGGQILTEVLA